MIQHTAGGPIAPDIEALGITAAQLAQARTHAAVALGEDDEAARRALSEGSEFYHQLLSRTGVKLHVWFRAGALSADGLPAVMGIETQP